MGGSSRFNYSTPLNQKEIKTSVNEILNRHKTILKILKMSTLSSFKSSNLSALILGAIPEILSKSFINSKNQKIIGWQSNQSNAKDMVFKRPFDALISINCTIGKLIVLENWKRLVAHSNFLLQSNYDKAFGFQIKNRESISSKHFRQSCFPKITL